MKLSPIIDKKVIAYPEDFKPSNDNMKVIGVFNPGVTTLKTPRGLETLIMYRVAETAKKEPSNGVYVPRIAFEETNTPLILDFIENKDITETNKKPDITEKEVKFSKNGIASTRLRHLSRFHTGILDNDDNFKQIKTNLKLSHHFEEYGIEDPRITRFNDNIYKKVGYQYGITYVVPHPLYRVSTIIMLTNDFKNFEWLPKGNTNRPVTMGKDIAIFPGCYESVDVNLITGKKDLEFVIAIRPSEHPAISDPTIYLEYSPNLTRFGTPHRLIEENNSNILGTGPPPIEINGKLLMMYHEAIGYTSQKAKKVGHSHYYVTKYMILDPKEPWKLLSYSDILLRREDFNDILPNSGFVPNVVYTTGLVKIGENQVAMYHGIDDTWTVKTIHDIIKS